MEIDKVGTSHTRSQFTATDCRKLELRDRATIADSARPTFALLGIQHSGFSRP